MYVNKFLTKKVKSWIMKEGSREMLIPPLQIKAVVFNISCTHRQKRQKVHYSFVDGVYLSSFIECLWTSDKNCRVQVFPSAGSTNCRPNVS